MDETQPIPNGTVANTPPSSRLQWNMINRWSGGTDGLFGAHIRPGWIRHPRERVAEDWKDLLSEWFLRWIKWIFATFIVFGAMIYVTFTFPSLVLIVFGWGTVFIAIGIGEYISRIKNYDIALINQIKGRRVLKNVLPENYEINERAETVQDTRTEATLLYIPHSIVNLDPSDGGVGIYGARIWPLTGGRNVFLADYHDLDENRSKRIRTIIGTESDAFSNLAIAKTLAPEFWYISPRFKKAMERVHKKIRERQPEEVQEIITKMNALNEQIRHVQDIAFDIQDLVGHPPFDWVTMDEATMKRKYFKDHIIAMSKMNERWLQEKTKFGNDPTRVIGDAVNLFETADAVQRHLSALYTAHGKILAKAEIASTGHYARMASIGSEPLDKYIQLMESKLDKAVDNNVRLAEANILSKNNVKSPIKEEDEDGDL